MFRGMLYQCSLWECAYGSRWSFSKLPLAFSKTGSPINHWWCPTFSQFFGLPPSSLIAFALRLLDQHPDTSRSLPTCNLILSHWGSHQPLKPFFPDIATLTFRLLPSSTALQHVCVSSKSCSICNLRWYSGKTSTYLTSVVVGFKASCLMLIIWFWGIDTCSRSCKTFVGKRDSFLFARGATWMTNLVHRNCCVC